MASESLYVQLGRIMRGPKVREALDATADKLAADAQSIADAETGENVGITRSDGIRPKGRPYARVSASASHEHGNATTPRRRILGRAALRITGQ